MPGRPTKRDFLRVIDLSREELEQIVYGALALKRTPESNLTTLEGKALGMIFDKSSTRTRVSFEVGIGRLGGRAIYLSRNDLQLGRGESVVDTARVLSRFLDGIIIRTYAHDGIADFARHAGVPVINALTDSHHPCQALADFQTIIEHKGTTELRVAYVGDGNNVAHSLIEAAVLLGADLRLACPENQGPARDVIDDASPRGPGSVSVTVNPEAAVAEADVVYTDTWVSMGQEDEKDRRTALFQPYQVNRALLAHAKPDAIVMHCLPAHRGHEITDEVLDGPQSVVLDQAENRLYSQMALLDFLLA